MTPASIKTGQTPAPATQQKRSSTHSHRKVRPIAQSEAVTAALQRENPGLRFGDAKDSFEREADRVALQVVTAAQPIPDTVHPSQTTTAQATGRQAENQSGKKTVAAHAVVAPKPLAVKSKTQVNLQRVYSQCEEDVQLKGDDNSEEWADSRPQSWRDSSQEFTATIRTIRQGGEPLRERNFYETRMGADFSSVRIHNDARAHQLAAVLGAKAFTHRNHIVFAQGYFAPQQTKGKLLLAHELTHVVQQGVVPSASSRNSGAPRLQADLLDDAGTLWNSGVNLVADTASDAGDFVVSGARRVGGAVVRGAEYVGDLAVDAYESTRDFVLAYLEEYAPGLLTFLRGDIVGTIKGKIIEGLDYLFNGFGSRIQQEGLVGALTGVFGEFTGTVQQIATDLAGGNCESLFAAMQTIAGFGERLMGPAFDEIRALLGMAGDFFGELWAGYGQPFWEAIQTLAGSAWTWITEQAQWLWDQTAELRNLASYIWDEFKRLFNIAWDSTGDLLSWIKDEALAAWEEIKEFLGPALLPLQIAGAIFLLFTPLAPVVLIGVGVPLLWHAVGWLVENWDDLEIVIIAREILANDILPALESGLATIQGLLQSAGEWISAQVATITTSLLQAVGAIGAMPLLNALLTLVSDIADLVNDAMTWLGETFVSLLTDLRDLALEFLHFIQPLAVLVFAIIMFPTMPWILAIVLTGWAWRILPDCFKPSIIDFWLSTAIGFVQAMPDFEMFGPIWPQAKTHIIRALQNLQALDTAAKIEGSNRIAKMMTGEDFTWIANLGRAVWQMPEHFMGSVEEELLGQDLNQPLPIERLPEDALDADSGRSIDEAAALLGKSELTEQDVAVDRVAETTWDAALIEELNIPDGEEVFIGGGMDEAVASPEGVADEMAVLDGVELTPDTAGGEVAEPIPTDPEEQLTHLANQPSEINCDAREKIEEPATAEEVPIAARQYGPFTPMQRLSYMLSQMGRGVSQWFNCNKHWVVPSLIIAIVALIVLIVVTEGAILGVIGSALEIIAAVMIGVSLVRMTAWLGRFLSEGIAGQIGSSARSLAKALAIGSIELIFALLFSLGAIIRSARSGFRAARAGGAGVTRSVAAGARSGARETAAAARTAVVPGFEATARVGSSISRSASAAARTTRRVGGAVIRNGRLIINGVEDGFAAGIRSLRSLRSSIRRLRFNGFSMARRGRWFALYGHFNPKMLLASGYIVDVGYSGTGSRPRRGITGSSRSGRPGIVIGVRDKYASSFVRYAEGLSLAERQALYRELQGLTEDARRVRIAGIGQTAENARQLRASMLGAGARPGRGVPGGGNAAHHIVPGTHPHPSATAARQILEDAGISFNHGVNGVFLPQPIHAPLHSAVYMDEVLRRLLPVRDMAQAGATKAEQAVEAARILDQMATDILGSNFLH